MKKQVLSMMKRRDRKTQRGLTNRTEIMVLWAALWGGALEL